MSENTQQQESTEEHALIETYDPIHPLQAQLEEGEKLKKALNFLIKTVLVMACVLIFQSGAVIYLMTKVANPPKEYFAIQAEGGLLPMHPLDKPFRTNSSVEMFVRDALTCTMNLSFNNYKADLVKCRKYFDDAGYENFLKQLEQKGYMKPIKEDRMNMSGAVDGARVVRQFKLNGVFTRQVQAPIAVRFAGQNITTAPQNFDAVVTVKEASSARTSEGILITQIVTK